MNLTYRQPLPHLFYDLVIPAVVGRPAETYFAIRRFLWTKPATGEPEVGRATQNGQAVAYVSQAKVAHTLGYTRQTINEHVARLKQLQWLEAKVVRHGGSKMYVLGRWGKVPEDPEETCSRPTFWFDERLREIAGELKDRLAGSRYGAQSLAGAPPEVRRDHVREIIETKWPGGLR